MRRGRITSAVVALTTAALVAAGPAWAAPSKNVVRDLKDGTLDTAYTQQELSRALRNATVQGYGNPTVVANVAGQETQLASAGRAAALPFTGVDLLLLTAGGIFLLALGAGLRRAAAPAR